MTMGRITVRETKELNTESTEHTEEEELNCGAMRQKGGSLYAFGARDILLSPCLAVSVVGLPSVCSVFNVFIHSAAT